MQKLSLKDFEHHISPVTWEAADDLVQGGQVKKLQEIEKHFWVGRLETDLGDFEAEVIITPHKIKAYACECFTEGRRLMCPHIAATLLKIRQFYAQKEDDRQLRAQRKSSQELTRLTVQTALENASPEALADFVREYARRDRDFSLALKTRFAALVSESENPYALLLDSVLPKPKPAQKVTEADFRRLRKALDGLEAQLNLATNAEDFRGRFQISSAILLKINYLIEKLEGNRREALLYFSRLSFETLLQLHDQAPSPELRQSVWDLLFEFSNKQIYPLELQREALQFLSQTASENSKFTIIQTQFIQVPYPAPAFLLHLYLAALAVRKLPEGCIRVLEEYSSQAAQVKAAFLQLYYLKQWDAATLVGEHFLQNKVFDTSSQREIEDVLLFIAETTRDTTRQLKWTQHRFLLSGNIDTFGKLKNVAQKKWPKVLKQVVKTLQTKPDIPKLATVFFLEDDKVKLAELIENQDNIVLLQRYESSFLTDDKAFIKRMYLHFLGRYLTNHFGAPAAQQVRLYLSELLQKGERDLTIEIIKALGQQFPERTSLPSELAELFPRSKRKSF